MTRRRAPLALVMLACAPHPLPSPAPVSLDMAGLKPVTEFLDSAVASGAAPGAVLAVARDGQRFVYGSGQLGADEPESPGAATIYDLASLTKVVGLVSGAMLAVDEGKLELDAPVQQYVPAFAGTGKDRITVRMLLAHASGLPAWRPLFREAASRAEAFALADTTPLSSDPGTVEVYSDLGAIILTQMLEAIYHQRLDSLLQRRIFGPLGMSATGFLPGADQRDRIAPTEMDPWRGRVLRGEVQDENAALMDGVSGHAGLFGSAEDLLIFTEWMLRMWARTECGPEPSSPAQPCGPTIHQSILREFTRRQNLVPGSSRALGWDTPSPGGSAGSRLSPRSFGHTGFTGTSLWID
ncbi:MAG TPA: serine hydrolase domain-containing protein, partial [Gemmatimonadales bacterium]|nr:serine hydrolase domain-containing protein [Gemmatimonadales bacterium]